MRTLVLVMFSFLTISTAQASQLSCETLVGIEVSKLIGEDKAVKSIEETVVSEDESIYTVRVGLKVIDPSSFGILYGATYEVSTESGPQGSCIVSEPVLIAEHQ